MKKTSRILAAIVAALLLPAALFALSHGTQASSLKRLDLTPEQAQHIHVVHVSHKAELNGKLARSAETQERAIHADTLLRAGRAEHSRHHAPADLMDHV